MARCSRSWEVEAARDGRLGDRARIDHERHLERCDDCTAEAGAFERLETQLRALDVRMPDELTMRRHRGRTLELAAAAIAGGEPSRSRVRIVPWLAFAVLVIALIGWRGARHTSESACSQTTKAARAGRRTGTV